ncbi:MAG: HEAT repeat domain-containing protein [Nitrospiraceae bacterium]|nr:HEAT repeat domain-containing protein [Nitrospiraceae bacterium]
MRTIGLITMLFLCLVTLQGTAAAVDQAVFGPTTYNVKDRYGVPNRYTASFSATDGIYLIKVQNGDKPYEQSDWIELTMNGEKLLADGKYPYPFIAGIVPLKKENTFQLVVKDDRPSGFKRPVLPPRFVTISVWPVPADVASLQGLFGLKSWDGLSAFAQLIFKIQDPQAMANAIRGADLRLSVDARAEALRNLSDKKIPAAAELLANLYRDIFCVEEVRGEAAIGLALLGDTKYIPFFMQGIMDPEVKVSIPSARALSLYREEDTQDQLTTVLSRLDAIRKDAVIRSIVKAGWKPVSTLVKMTDNTDPQVSSLAIGILGEMREKRATDHLLQLLSEPGKRSMAAIVSALGDAKDLRAVEPLLQLANDKEKRKNIEAEVGEALADLGDQRAAAPISDMLKTTTNPQAFGRLLAAYKKLTGKDFK